MLAVFECHAAAFSHDDAIVLAHAASLDAMKTPAGLQPLIDDGIVDEVIRALKSGKEASVYVVRCGAEVRCAKVYKDMGQRSFQQRAIPGRTQSA